MPYSLETAWSFASAYVLYVVARLAPKPDGFEEKMNRIRASDPQLTHMDLSGMGLSYWNIIELCYVLASNTTLTSLNVGNNRIGDAVAQALATHTSLTSLNVSENRIGAAGAQALATNTILTSLDVSFNQIGDAGAQALATNTTLTSLNVGNNQIGAAGAQALATNKTLKSLNVSPNDIGAAGAQALARNTTLASLDVSWNDIGDAGAQALATNTILASLDVSFNQIGATGAQALATNTTLTVLNVCWNNIDPANDRLVTSAIIRNIEAKKTMVRLHAFASIANNDFQSPQYLPEDVVQKVCSFFTTDAGCLNKIRLRAAERSSRDVFFQPVGTVDSTAPSNQHLTVYRWPFG